MIIKGYSSSNLMADGLPLTPDRGKKCARCGSRVPVFLDLPEKTEIEIRALTEYDKLAAMDAIKKETGCNVRWAKIWVANPDDAAAHRFKGPPCPYCGIPLPNERSRQCLSCG